MQQNNTWEHCPFHGVQKQNQVSKNFREKQINQSQYKIGEHLKCGIKMITEL